MECWRAIRSRGQPDLQPKEIGCQAATKATGARAGGAATMHKDLNLAKAT